ncbi:MAG: thioredoxin domain-containing protein [Alphaproteobacteria bacterium]|nr:thioredoxin domain-containing protein [Alphaproteobacteria bacterium]
MVLTPAQAAPLSAEEALKDRILGDPNAPIEIIEYSSLTCPHCRHFHTEILPELKEKYLDTGKAKLIYRDFPFDQLGLTATLLSRCAPPSRYFQFLDVLFQNQEKWSRDPNPLQALTRIGKLGGLSEADFKACTENKAIVDGVLQTRLAAGNRYEVSATPTFVINGEKRIVGSQPFEVFDDLLKKLEK